MASKHTFVLDDEAAALLRAIAAREGKPQSQIVREAIAVYARQEARLSADERARKLAVLDAMARRAPTRSAAEVDAELGELRRSRRRGWRRPSD